LDVGDRPLAEFLVAASGVAKVTVRRRSKPRNEPQCWQPKSIFSYSYNMPLTSLQKTVGLHAEQIEKEMRRIGVWQKQPLRPEQLGFKQAFAMDTMTFSQWLQFIFLPRVCECVASNNFPPSSSVGTHAIREFDGCPETDHLVQLLSEFDALFG
jgi:uncharacterized protein YqcC (DUF446 family)